MHQLFLIHNILKILMLLKYFYVEKTNIIFKYMLNFLNKIFNEISL